MVKSHFARRILWFDPEWMGSIDVGGAADHCRVMTITVTIEEAEERLEELLDAAVAGEEVLIVSPDGEVIWLKPLVAPDRTPLE